MTALDDLLVRLRARAADPERRVDVRPSAFQAGVSALDLGGLFERLAGAAADLRKVVADNQAGRVDPDLHAKAESIGAAMSTPVGAGLPAPASGDELERAETDLGFPLPAVLRRVYLEVADGGFGPAGGLLGLRAAVAAYGRLRSGVELPRGRAWPDRLVPLVEMDGGYDCVDASSAAGRIVAWDPEGLTERSAEPTWNRTFSEVAPSVEAWLEAWVGAKTQAEQHQELMQRAMLDAVRQSRAHFAAMTPEQRAAYGLPEVGWERQIGGGLGLDDDDASQPAEAGDERPPGD